MESYSSYKCESLCEIIYNLASHKLNRFWTLCGLYFVSKQAAYFIALNTIVRLLDVVGNFMIIMRGTSSRFTFVSFFFEASLSGVTVFEDQSWKRFLEISHVDHKSLWNLKTDVKKVLIIRTVNSQESNVGFDLIYLLWSLLIN